VESIDEARHLLANIQKNWLLILDNADDPEFDYQIYFPSGTWGTIIMTSRVVDTHHYQTVGTERLASLDEGDSLGLLFKVAKIPSESWSSQEQAAKEVIKTLGHHTLALIQAGAYIAKGHCSMEDFPGVFRRQRERLLKFRPKQAQSRYSDVFTTFEATASMLKYSGTTEASDALCLLEVVSMLHFSEIPMQVFEDAWKGSQKIIEAGPKKDSDIRDLSEWHVSQLPEFLRDVMDEWDPFRLREASHLLASLSLITESTRDGFPEISMHSLVHAWVKDRLSSEERNRVWSMTGSTLALSFYTSTPWRPYYRQLQPHAHTYVDLYVNRMYSLNQNRSIAQMILMCGWVLYWMREDTLVAELLKRLFAELRIDPSHPSLESVGLLDLYDLQGRSLYHLGHFKQAVQLGEQIFHIRETTLAEDHPERLTAQLDLASAYLENGQIVQAVQSFEQIVDKARQKLPEDDYKLLACQHELARAYEMNGQINEAIQLLEHVVNVKKITLTEDLPDQLTSQLVLARAYRKNDRIREAIQLLEHVVKIRRTTVIESHPTQLESEQELALAYKANDQIEEAVQLLEHVVKIKESKLAEDDSRLLRSQHELAVAYKANDQIEKAVQLFEHVVNIRKTTLTEDHPELLASELWLVIAFKANGQIREATQLLEHLNQIEGKSRHLDGFE
jgi:tetratricopeptide (TPR) repeat protein